MRNHLCPKGTYLVHGTIELCIELSTLSSFEYKSETIPVGHERSFGSNAFQSSTLYAFLLVEPPVQKVIERGS